jgi:transcriptional regulator with XRE-family HTH domain
MTKITANIVSEVRKSRLLSMNALADLADVPASTISRIEAGEMEPTFFMLERIVGAAGFSLNSRVQEAGSDQPFATFLDRLNDKGGSFDLVSAKELLTIASLALVARRKGAKRVELSTSLKDAIQTWSELDQAPIISSLEAYNKDIQTLQSFVPVVYVDNPEAIPGLEPVTMRSLQVMFILPTTDNVRKNTRAIRGIDMVVPEWGMLDALASPGRQPDAALKVFALRKGAVA